MLIVIILVFFDPSAVERTQIMYLWRATMEVVYIFRESDSSRYKTSVPGGGYRIPFFDNDQHLYCMLLSVGGGVWDRERREFFFGDNVNSARFRRIASYVPYVYVDDNAAQRLSIFGFWDLPPEKPSNFYPAGKGIVPAESQKEKKAELPSPPANPPIKIFSMLGPLPPPEKFPELWQNKLEAELRSRKYSPRTRRCYMYYNRLICRILQKPPEEIHAEDVTRFLAVMEKDREYSASSINLAISAIKFFYREVMKIGTIDEQHRPRHDGRLPQVLSKEEIHKILENERNPKHRLLLMLVYSSGLRVSEVVALKREHIDLSRRVINVRLGKGRKDRCTLLSEKAAQFIAEYYEFFGIEKWLFPGQPPTRPLTIRSAQHIFDKAVRRAEIRKKITIHGLRHTFATHLLESGTDIRYIQTLLGHANVRTTERYTHIARRDVLKIQSPLDTIP